MPRSRILVINPNSDTDVTAAVDAAVDPFRFAEGPEIVCTTLEEGPRGVETQKDADSVTMPLRRLVEGAKGIAALVIACDGIDLCLRIGGLTSLCRELHTCGGSQREAA